MPKIERSEDGTWEITEDWRKQPSLYSGPAVFWEVLPQYLTAIDKLFLSAQRTCEFEFILALLGVRGVQDPGWDPYETTLACISSVVDLHQKNPKHTAGPHITLWLYGHIVEASEPYEILANLVRICQGQRFSIDNFPRKKNGAPLSPGQRIAALRKMSDDTPHSELVDLLSAFWDRDLRNAVFHSDYCQWGIELRIRSPFKKYSAEQKEELVNRAFAYHEALARVHKLHLASYDQPKLIPTHPEFDPNGKAMVIVREGFGAVGLKTVWTHEQLARGEIPVQVGRFFPAESKMLSEDPTTVFLPAGLAAATRQPVGEATDENSGEGEN